MKLIARAVFAATVAFAGASSGAEIGAVAAVNRDVQGARPSEPPRRLVLKEKLIQNERVTTSAESGGQVLFIDQTTLTLTPNSDIILDKYVFDPDKDQGELAVTMLRGAMRMVGGRITKSSAALIKTPSATIGIRGGIGNITVRDDGSTEYMHIAGFSAEISTPAGEKVTITREGGMAEVTPPAGGTEAFVSEALGDAGQTAPSASEQQQAALAESAEEGELPGAPAAREDGGGGEAPADQASAPSADDGGGAETPAADDGAPGGDNTGTGETGGAETAGGDTGGGETGGGDTGGGKITYLGVATPEMVRATMSVRAGTGDGGSPLAADPAQIQGGIQTLEQTVSAEPNAIVNPPISTTGEQQEADYAAPPPRLDDRPIEEFTDNEVAMATEAEVAAQEIAQELNAVTFSGAWSATAGLTNGGFAPTESDLAFRMQYSLLDQEGFVTIQLPGGQDGAALTTFDGAAILGDRFLIVGDDALSLVADAERLTLLGGDADGTSLVISPSDIADGSIFVDYEGLGLSQLDFVDGTIVGLTGQRLTTAETRERVRILQESLPVATD